jgi:26S proteasome regulatory subunit T2
VKDWLLMEEEYVTNQERLKPQEERNEEDRSKVDDLRGSPLSVGTLEELIDEKCVILYWSFRYEDNANLVHHVCV